MVSYEKNIFNLTRCTDCYDVLDTITTEKLSKNTLYFVFKTRFKRRILHVPNLMQMRKIYCFRSFALDLAHGKFDV